MNSNIQPFYDNVFVHFIFSPSRKERKRARTVQKNQIESDFYFYALGELKNNYIIPLLKKKHSQPPLHFTEAISSLFVNCPISGK